MGGLTSDVVLLLHCDGSAGTSVLTEHQYGVKLTPRVQLGSITAGGKWAQYLGLQQTSLQFLAFSAPMVLDLGWSTPFTIDFWCYTVTSYQVGRTAVMWECTNAAGTSLFRTVLGGYGGDSGPHQLTYLGSTMKGISALSTLVWQHWAFVRTASCFGYFFVNGVKVGSAGPTSYNMSIATTQSYFWFGRYWGLEHLTGVIEELRIVNGVAMWESDFTPPTDRYNPELPIAEMDFLASNVQPLFVQNQSLQIANRFRYDTVRKIPDMSAAQVRACLMSAGYTFDPDNDHDFDSVSANSIASVRLYPTITEDDTSDVTSVYFSDIPWSGSASTVGMLLTVAKDFTSTHNSTTIFLMHADGSEGGSVLTNAITGSTATVGGGYTTASNAFLNQGYRISGNTEGAYFTSLSNFTLGTSAFTIDYRWAFSDVPALNSTRTTFIFDKFVSGALGRVMAVHTWASNSYIAYLLWASTVGALTWYYRASIAASLSANTVYHGAWVRNATSLFFFWNGVSCGIYTSGSAQTSFLYSLGGAELPLYIAQRGSYTGTAGTSVNQTIDEFRIVIGSAIWTANFTPPTSAHEIYSVVWSGETIVGFLSFEETIPANETLTVKGVSVRLT